MFDIGDLIIYSGQGICHIDDICAKTYLDVTKAYYVLHPIENCKLTISIPVDNDKVIMLGLIDRNEAEEIIESFKMPGIRVMITIDGEAFYEGMWIINEYKQ